MCFNQKKITVLSTEVHKQKIVFFFFNYYVGTAFGVADIL